MIRHLLFVLALFCFFSLDVAAQAPNLPAKETLSQILLSGKTFSSATAVDTAVKRHEIPDNYTLEVVGRVNTATGRGLDIEARSAKVKGFRLSLDASSLKWTAPLASGRVMSASNAGEDQTIRIAVRNNQAHIYQNGAYLETQPLATIKDIAGGVEVEGYENTENGGPSLVADWAGRTGDNAGRPSDYGWALTNTTNTSLFNTANSGSGVRYIDVNQTTNRHTLNGETYVGRIMFIRWDAENIRNAGYSYPVTLEANTTYNFSLLHAYWSNSTGGRSMSVGIGKTTAATDRLASQPLHTTGTATLKRDSFVFTSEEAGTYYLTFTGDWGLFSISDLKLNKLDTTPRFVFGKNYPDGAVDMQISSVTFEEGAYAPAAVVTGPKQDLTVSGAVVKYPTTFNTNFIVNGKTELHFTAEVTPFVNSSVELNSEDAWLYFDNIRPRDVINNWLRHVKVNGATAVNNTNVRVAIYKNGAVVIPNGNLTNAQALEVFTQPNLAGNSRKLAIETYHNNLGEFDNAIKSFKLRKGYMATLASNADGSGFSRVFIANEDDLIVNTMPEGLDGSVSFIRVFRWDWVSKKGKAGWSPDKINSTWYYDWNIGGGSASNYDYVIIRQHGGWPSWDAINSKQNVNHLLGHNEPDRPDQANLTVEQSFAQWPDMMKSGLRIGTPAPANPHSSWITDFMAKAEQMNYRVDFVAIHCYWGGLSPQQWYSQLKSIYDRVKRPLWITEWNNGANWTTESWPADQAAQFEKQLNDMKGILHVLDTASFVERYAIYDWVENKRAMVLGDTLTPAGKYYAANKSNFAFSRKREYIHTWKLLAPTLTSAINSNDVSKVTLSWKDINGEMGAKYIVERRLTGTETEFQPIGEVTEYVKGGNVTFVDDVHDRATYRVKALSYNEETFKYSATLDVVRDAAATPPASLTGHVISATTLRLNWIAGTNARSYNLKRGLSPEGPFETIISSTNQFTFLDENLEPNTPYYYAVTSLNTAGESENSTILELRTNQLVAPTAVQSPRIASGDAKVTLTWDFAYDVMYDILRSETENGTYTPIATNVSGVRYEDTNRENNRTYYYKVVAHNAAGRSAETQVLTGMPQPGQFLYVGFDEEGTVAADAWGGYHATLATAAGRESGHTGQALRLDGSSTAFAQLPAGVVSTLDDITVAAWVKMDALSNWMRVFDFGTGTSTYMFLTVQANVSSGKSTVRYTNRRGSAEAEKQLSYAHTFPLNTWTHIAVTQSGNTARMYINGTLVATNTDFSNKPSELGVTTQNYIGKSQYNDPMFRGKIDEFRIYNQALSEESISSLASSQPLAARKDINSSVLIYPNPASSVINISGLEARTYQYKVYNLVGSKVAEGTVQQGQILLPATIANGNYILQLTDNEKTDIRKHIVVQK